MTFVKLPVVPIYWHFPRTIKGYDVFTDNYSYSEEYSATAWNCYSLHYILQYPTYNILQYPTISNNRNTCDTSSQKSVPFSRILCPFLLNRKPIQFSFGK